MRIILRVTDLALNECIHKHKYMYICCGRYENDDETKYIYIIDALCIAVYPRYAFQFPFSLAPTNECTHLAAHMQIFIIHILIYIHVFIAIINISIMVWCGCIIILIIIIILAFKKCISNHRLLLYYKCLKDAKETKHTRNQLDKFYECGQTEVVRTQTRKTNR